MHDESREQMRLGGEHGQFTATGWPVCRLDQVARVQTGIAKGAKRLRNPLTLPYLRVANVQDGFLDLATVKEIRVEASDVHRYRLQPGDVLLTEGGDFDKLGRGTIWGGQIRDCLHQNHVFAVRCNESRLTPEYLAALTASGYGRRYFLSCSKQSTNLASINTTQLRAFPIPLPPLAEQRRITEVLATWDAALRDAQALMSATETQKRGLMQQLLSGVLRVSPGQGPDSYSAQPERLGSGTERGP